MSYTIVSAFLSLWLLGIVAGTMIGGLIHVILVIAMVMLLLNVISSLENYLT